MICASPCLNHVPQLLRLVDAGVVHNDDGVVQGEWVHIVQQTLNKCVEVDCLVRVILYIEVQDAAQ